MNIIAAMAEDRVIGGPEGLLWDLPEERRQLLGLVEGQVVILGRRAYEMFGAELPSSRTLVVSRTLAEAEGASVAPSLEAALSEAWGLGGKLFCAGGASLFEQTLPLAERLYLSTVHGRYEGTHYFPPIGKNEWSELRRREYQRFDFTVYRRVR